MSRCFDIYMQKKSLVPCSRRKSNNKEAADQQAEIFERMRFPFPESGSIEIAEEHNAEDAEQAVRAELDESGYCPVVERCQMIEMREEQSCT